MSSLTRQQLERWLKNIDVKANRVLDIGGSQLPIQNRVRSWNVQDYKILDLDTPHEEKKKADYGLDIQDSANLAVYRFGGMGTFDVVFCMEVTEYWYDPMKALTNIASLMNKDGLLYLSTHFIYPVHSPSQEDCIRYTRNGITKMLEKAGFKIEEITSREWEKTDFQDVITLEGMRPDRGYGLHNEIGTLIKCSKA